MSEAETLGLLAGFTDTVLVGLSVFFTVVSAYVAGLNYFVRRSPMLGRICAFAFLTFILALLLAVMQGAQVLHDGLLAGLRDLPPQELTLAGRAAIANADARLMPISGQELSLNAVVRYGLWGGMALTYAGLFFLTFVFRWGDED